uniref:T-box domain-containing protein n=1 Tax=Strigamia maritima TaxID=126957 RepID=T1IXJ9_STRMM
MPSTRVITHHLLPVVKNLIAASDLEMYNEERETAVQVRLLEMPLWSQFRDQTNEMIVTKTGRRMFPVFKIDVSGLDANGMYSIFLEFVQLDSHRWRFRNGQWTPGGDSEPRRSTSDTVYTHPESPNFGAHWMKNIVSFEKIKLSSKPHDNAQIVINSMHRYQPRIHIIKVEIPSPIKCYINSFTFPETQFIAVTAYQNQEVTNLKIRNNPFAKAFIDVKKRSQIEKWETNSYASYIDYPTTSTSPQNTEVVYPPTQSEIHSHFDTDIEKYERISRGTYFQPSCQWQSTSYENSSTVIQNNQLDLFYPYPTTPYSEPYNNFQTLNYTDVFNEDFNVPQQSEDWSQFNTFPQYI